MFLTASTGPSRKRHLKNSMWASISLSTTKNRTFITGSIGSDGMSHKQKEQLKRSIRCTRGVTSATQKSKKQGNAAENVARRRHISKS